VWKALREIHSAIDSLPHPFGWGTWYGGLSGSAARHTPANTRLRQNVSASSEAAARTVQLSPGRSAVAIVHRAFDHVLPPSYEMALDSGFRPELSARPAANHTAPWGWRQAVGGATPTLKAQPVGRGTNPVHACGVGR
jgi:hypothetical protein